MAPPCTINPSPSPSPEPEREAQTFLALLRDHMNGTADSSRGRLRMSHKERLGLKGLGCCGATWGFRATTITNDDLDHEQEDMELVMVNSGDQEGTQERVSYPVCLDPTQQYSSGMNLAAALEIISWSPPMLLTNNDRPSSIKHLSNIHDCPSSS